MPQMEGAGHSENFKSSFYHSHGNLTANYMEVRSKARLRPGRQKICLS